MKIQFTGTILVGKSALNPTVDNPEKVVNAVQTVMPSICTELVSTLNSQLAHGEAVDERCLDVGLNSLSVIPDHPERFTSIVECIKDQIKNSVTPESDCLGVVILPITKEDSQQIGGHIITPDTMVDNLGKLSVINLRAGVALAKANSLQSIALVDLLGGLHQELKNIAGQAITEALVRSRVPAVSENKQPEDKPE